MQRRGLASCSRWWPCCCSVSPSSRSRASRGEDALRGIADGSVGVIDADDAALEYQVTTGRETHGAATGAGSVWVIHARQGTVSRIDARGERVKTIDVGPAPTALAFGAGSLWVASGDDGIIAQVDPTANRVVQRIPVGNGLRAVAVGHGARMGGSRARRRGRPHRPAFRLDGEEDRRWAAIPPRWQRARAPYGWRARSRAPSRASTPARRRSSTRSRSATLRAPSWPGFGAVWAANRADGTVSRIDPRTDRVTDTMPAGRAPVALAVARRGAVDRRLPRCCPAPGPPRTRSHRHRAYRGQPHRSRRRAGRAVGHGGGAARRSPRWDTARREPADRPGPRRSAATYPMPDRSPSWSTKRWSRTGARTAPAWSESWSAHSPSTSPTRAKRAGGTSSACVPASGSRTALRSVREMSGASMERALVAAPETIRATLRRHRRRRTLPRGAAPLRSLARHRHR